MTGPWTYLWPRCQSPQVSWRHQYTRIFLHPVPGPPGSSDDHLLWLTLTLDLHIPPLWRHSVYQYAWQPASHFRLSGCRAVWTMTSGSPWWASSLPVAPHCFRHSVRLRIHLHRRWLGSLRCKKFIVYLVAYKQTIKHSLHAQDLCHSLTWRPKSHTTYSVQLYDT